MAFATIRHGRRHFRALVALGKCASDGRHDELIGNDAWQHPQGEVAMKQGESIRTVERDVVSQFLDWLEKWTIAVLFDTSSKPGPTDLLPRGNRLRTGSGDGEE